MNLKPLHDWAVIRPAGAEEMTAGGLIIPDTAKEKPQEGVVEAIGPGAYEEEEHRRKKTGEKKERRFIPTTVKPGDRVIYERYAGRTYTISGEERILVRERDILGILERPLQIPAITSTSAATAAVSVRPVPSPVMKVKETSTAGKTEKGTVQKSVKKKTSKTAPKKKAAGKAVKKAAAKSKTGAKKTTGVKGPGTKVKKAAVKKTKKKK